MWVNLRNMFSNQKIIISIEFNHVELGNLDILNSCDCLYIFISFSLQLYLLCFVSLCRFFCISLY